MRRHIKGQYSFFTSVFTRENTKHIPTLDNVFTGAPLQDLCISQQMLENMLSKLKTNKSSGQDRFHSRVLEETSSIGLPVSILYNMSLTEGHMHGRKGTLLQFTKKSSKTDAGNYRQVSLTSVLGKVMESFIRDHLVDHMMKNRLFCEAHHGFVPGRSCMTQLLNTLVSSSSSCHQTFRFHCSVHLYPISLNFRMSSKVQGCVKIEHRNIYAVLSASSPHAHVVYPLKYPHFFICSLLQVYPVRSVFVIYPLP